MGGQGGAQGNWEWCGLEVMGPRPGGVIQEETGTRWLCFRGTAFPLPSEPQGLSSLQRQGGVSSAPTVEVRGALGRQSLQSAARHWFQRFAFPRCPSHGRSCLAAMTPQGLSKVGLCTSRGLWGRQRGHGTWRVRARSLRKGLARAGDRSRQRSPPTQG